MCLLAAECNRILLTNSNGWRDAFTKILMFAAEDGCPLLPHHHHLPLTSPLWWIILAQTQTSMMERICMWVGAAHGRAHCKSGDGGVRGWGEENVFFFSFFVFKSSKHIFQEAAQWLAVGNVSLLASSKVMLAGAVSDGRGALKKVRTHTNKAHIHPE